MVAMGDGKASALGCDGRTDGDLQDRVERGHRSHSSKAMASH